MPLRIEQHADRLVVRDTPSGQWLFGSLFVASGLVVLSIPIISDAWAGFVAWQRLAVLAIGVGHFGIGSWYVARHLETITTFDRASGDGISIRRRPMAWRRQAERFKVADVRAIEILRTVDSEGDPMYQLRLWLSGSRVLPLQSQPTHQLKRVRNAAEALRHGLGLPQTEAPEA